MWKLTPSQDAPQWLRILQTVLVVLLAFNLLALLAIVGLGSLLLHFGAEGGWTEGAVGYFIGLGVLLLLLALTFVQRPLHLCGGLFLLMLLVSAYLSLSAVDANYGGFALLLVGGTAVGLGSFVGDRRRFRRPPLPLLALCAASCLSGLGLLVFAAVAAPANQGFLWAIACSDARHAWVAGSGGVVLATADGGRTWTTQRSGVVDLGSVSFVDQSHGWVAGMVGGAVFATRDGGENWLAQRPRRGTTGTSKIVFADRRRGWLLGYHSLRTEDGGASWHAMDMATGKALWSAAFLDSRLGWAVGQRGTIVATNDGGRSWAKQAQPTTHDLWAVAASAPGHVVAVGDAGVALLTADGGKTWAASHSGTHHALEAIDFADPSHAWAVGERGTILATGDGGMTWMVQPSGTDLDLCGVAFADTHHGWAIGERGTILRTSDGGTTWSVVMTGAEWDL